MDLKKEIDIPIGTFLLISLILIIVGSLYISNTIQGSNNQIEGTTITTTGVILLLGFIMMREIIRKNKNVITNSSIYVPIILMFIVLLILLEFLKYHILDNLIYLN